MERANTEMKKELVSVIMPVCDELQYLQDAVESILAQTYTNLELIMIDSSSDHMAVKTLTGLYGMRIRYFYMEIMFPFFRSRKYKSLSGSSIWYEIVI